MSDWTEYLGRSRRMVESLSWLAAATLVALMLATTAALAMWFDRRAGQGQAETVMIELPPLPVDAVAEDPGPAPQTTSAAPDAPDAPDQNEAPPQAETALDDRPDIQPPDAPPPPDPVAEQVPDMAPLPPPPAPEPPVKKAEVELPRPVKQAPPVQKKKAKKAEVEQQPQGQKSVAQVQQNAGGASAAGSNATASEMARWKSKVQAVVARHMKRKTFGEAGKVRLSINLTASGGVAGVSVGGSTGNAAVDAAIRVHAQGLPAVPPPPGGGSQQVIVPIDIRG